MKNGGLRPVGRLHVVTDVTIQNRYTHLEIAQAAIHGGAETVQYREKRATTREMIATARAMVAVCRRAGIPLIVNDRVDVALAADAQGVHLGTEDFPIALARDLLGPDRIIGASATSLAEAEEAFWAGADYLGVGPVYATGTKPDACAPLGDATIEEIARAFEIPVIAVGGINAESVPILLRAGAHGIAVVGAVVATPDPAAATAGLRAALDAAREAARGGEGRA